VFDRIQTIRNIQKDLEKFQKENKSTKRPKLEFATKKALADGKDAVLLIESRSQGDTTKDIREWEVAFVRIGPKWLIKSVHEFVPQKVITDEMWDEVPANP
jgi:hypothetical protein